MINNRYNIIDKIGQGGMGEVYLVNDLLQGNRSLAMKTLRKAFTNKSMIENFKNEFVVMNRLKHPNLARVYEFGFDRHNSQYFIIMDYLEGNTIQDMLLRGITCSISFKFNVFLALLRTLEFIHCRSVLHRDVKPGNIMILNNNNTEHSGLELLSSNEPAPVKVMDFGLAQLGEANQVRSRGTLKYIAPEVFQEQISRASDIYSLGLTMVEFFINESLYTDRSTSEIIKIIQNKKEYQTLVDKVLEKVKDKGLREIFSRMIAYRPLDRFQNCVDIIAALQQLEGLLHTLETPLTREAYVLGASFVGRSLELSQLNQRVTRKETELMLVTGEPGVGKTRLFQEFKHSCQIKGTTVWEGKCFEHVAKPLILFIPVLSEALLTSPTKLVEQYGPQLVKILPNHSLLKSIKPISIQDPGIEHNILIQNITGFLIDFANQSLEPIVVLLHDIQWIDDSSREVLGEILFKLNQSDSDAPLIIFANGRPEAMETLQDIYQKQRLKEQILHPFESDQMLDYLEAIFGKNSIESSLRDSIPEIFQRTGGNPLFFQELIKSLVNDDIISRNLTGWHLKQSLVELPLPQNLEAALVSSLDQLDLHTLKYHFLQVMSLLDRPITWEELSQISEVDNEAIIELERKEIIQTKEIERDIYYQISHQLLSEMIIQQLPAKKQLHHHIMRRLEVIHEHHLDDYVLELAHHSSQSGNDQKAKYYLLRAAEQALDQYNSHQAISLYQQLLTFLDDSETEVRIDTLYALGKLLETVGDWEKGEEVLLEAIHHSRMYGDEKRQAQSLVILGNIYYKKSDTKRTRDSFEKAQQLYEKIGCQEGMADVLFGLGNFYTLSANYKEAMRCFDDCLQIAIDLEDKVKITNMLGSIGLIYGYKGEYNTARIFYEKQLKMAEELGRKHTQTQALFNIGVINYMKNNLDEALTIFQQNLVQYEELGDKHGISMVYNNLGNIASYKQKYHQAIEYQKKRFEIARELGDKLGQAMSIGNIGSIYCDTGNYDAAIECFERRLKIAQDLDDKHGMAFTYGKMGEAYKLKGNMDLALAFFNDAITINDQIGSKQFLGNWLIRKAETLLEMYELEEAASTISRAQEVTRKTGVQGELHHTNMVAVKIYEAQENIEGAIKLLTDMLATAHTLKDKADITYQIWKIKRDDFYRNQALTLFKEISNETGSDEYDKMIEEMEKVKSFAGDFDGESIVNIESEENILEDLTGRLNTIRQEVDQLAISLQGIKDPVAESAHKTDSNLYRNAELLLSLIRQMSSNLNLDQVLNSIIDVTIKASNAERGFLILLDEEDNWEFKAGRNMVQESFDGGEYQISRSVVKRVIETREPVFVDDTSLDSFFSLQESIDELNLLSIICLPLLARSSQNLIGVIYVDSSLARRKFTKYDVELMIALAHQAAISIENAQLYEKSVEAREELNRLNEEIRKLDDIKSKFISLTSHELRTPLAIIIGNIELMLNTSRGLLPKDMITKVDIAANAAKRLNDMIDRIFRLSQMDKPDIVFVREQTNLNSLINSIREEIMPLIQSREQSLIVTLHENEVIAKIHQNSLWQIIMNLLLNAIRFTPDRGQIELALLDRDADFEIQVKDTGIGIPDGEKMDIFKSFYKSQDVRYHSSGTIEFMSGGIGVGLSIVRSGVEMHGGSIRVESELEKGSTFIITIPKE